MKRETVLLAESLKSCLETIKKNNNSKIASDLLEADELISGYNTLVDGSWNLNDKQKDLIEKLFTEKINTLITDEVRALSVRKDVFEIAFTPKGKELKYSDHNTWSRENRQTGKPGRIIKKLLVYDYKERDIELFSNQLKAEIMCLGDFKIVEGDDICHWYNCDNYYSLSGTLGNSCMKYCECQSYFQVYKDLAKMLICLKDGKLLGRAILWEIDGKTYMDRVYVCMDYLEEQFYQKAMENKWIIRSSNSLLYDGDDQHWLTPDDNYKSGNVFNLVLKCLDAYQKFPYMDSFRYFNPDTLELFCTCPTSWGYVALSNTDGYWERGEERCCMRCGDCETVYEGDDGDFVWSEYEDAWLCSGCRIWNDWIEDYISADTNTIIVLHIDKEIEVPRNLVLDNFTNYDNKGLWPDFVKLSNGAYYTVDSVYWSDENNRYELINE